MEFIKNNYLFWKTILVIKKHAYFQIYHIHRNIYVEHPVYDVIYIYIYIYIQTY